MESEHMPVMILDAMGVLQPGFILLEQHPDRNGLMTVLHQEDQSIIKVHPNRVKPNCDGGCMAITHGDSSIAICPVCQKTHKIDNNLLKCDCGEFNVVGIIAGAIKQPRQKIKKHDEVNMLDLASKGELWVKEITFNSKTKAESFIIRIDDRYLSFNLYNGSYGKKGTEPDIDGLSKGNCGYEIKIDIGRWHKKMIKKGYKLFK
jgi:hypothetical protein